MSKHWLGALASVVTATLVGYHAGRTSAIQHAPETRAAAGLEAVSRARRRVWRVDVYARARVPASAG